MTRFKGGHDLRPEECILYFKTVDSYNNDANINSANPNENKKHTDRFASIEYKDRQTN